MTEISRTSVPKALSFTRPLADDAAADAVSSLDDLPYRTLVDQAPAVIYTVPCAAETPTYISPFVESMLGYPPDAFLGDRTLWRRCIHPEDRDRVRAVVEQAEATDDAFAVDYRMVAQNGRLLHVHDAALLARDAAGKPFCWQGVAQDVTDRTQAQAALAISEARYDAVWKAISDAVALSDAQGIVLAANPAYGDLYGIDLAQVIGHPFSVIFPEEVRAWAEEAYQTVFTAPDLPAPITTRVHHRDGSARDVEVRATFVERDGVRVAMVSVIRDVTARTTAEVALAASEGRFRALVQESTDIIVVFDPAGRLTYASPALERVLGYPNDAYVQGLRLDIVHSADVAAVIAAWTDVSSLPSVRRDVTYRARHADGRWVWLEGSFTNQVANPAVAGIVLNLRDVTEREAALQELRFRGELLDHATVAVIATDPHRIVTHWNRHAEVLYGWSCEEATGRHAGALLIEPANDIASLDMSSWLASGEPWEADLVCRRKDGTDVPVHMVNSPIRGSDGRLLGHIGVSVDISARRALEARLAHQATHDALTGLANRALFADRLEHALRVASRRGESVAVLTLDLDRFKLVNDALGHAAGDQLLAILGSRLTACLREIDTLARLGGDEFAVLLEDVAVETAQEIARRILATLVRPVIVANREIFVGASIGIVLSSPDRSAADELMRAADVALYRAKQAGRGIFTVFDPAALDATAGWLALEADLRRALVQGDLTLHYQPVVNLADGGVVAVEALARWDHVARGMVPPAEFIPLAEETGLITTLTRWAIRRACQQLATWRNALGSLAPPKVNVNVTTRDLRDPGLVEYVMATLAEAGLQPTSLQLEITERVLVEEMQAAERTLAQLQRHGVGLAIDDFGAGASSLASLRVVDVQTLKLDQSFVHGMARAADDRIVVGAMTAMAHALGIQVTAEGIETVEHLELARAAGCDRGQGYLFTGALPPDDLAAWLHKRAEQPSLARHAS